MKQFFAPLGVFFGGMVFLLIASLFLPSLDTAVVGLAANTTAIATHYWGWTWLMTSGVARWLYWMGGVMGAFFLTGLAFWRQRRSSY